MRARLQLGVAQDQVGLLLGVLLHLLGLLLRRYQRLFEGVLDVPVLLDLLFEGLQPVLVIDVLVEQPLELVGDVIEELVDFEVLVAAHGAAEFLVPDVQRRKSHLFFLPV